MPCKHFISFSLNYTFKQNIFCLLNWISSGNLVDFDILNHIFIFLLCLYQNLSLYTYWFLLFLTAHDKIA